MAQGNVRASAACAELKENKLTECLKSLCRISIAHDRVDVLHELADVLDELGMLGELDSQRTLLHLAIESNALQCFQVLVEAHARIASRERSVVLAGLGKRGNAIADAVLGAVDGEIAAINIQSSNIVSVDLT